MTYWMIERDSPCEWWVGNHKISNQNGGEWTTDSAKAQHFNEWGAKNHAKELESWGIRGPLRATEHIDVEMEPNPAIVDPITDVVAPDAPTPEDTCGLCGLNVVAADYSRKLERNRDRLQSMLDGTKAYGESMERIVRYKEDEIKQLQQRCTELQSLIDRASGELPSEIPFYRLCNGDYSPYLWYCTKDEYDALREAATLAITKERALRETAETYIKRLDKLVSGYYGEVQEG